MANLTVEEDGGGDYTTLDEACDNIGATETITIQGEWDAADTRAVIVSVDCNITATGAARVTPARHIAGTPLHYRLQANSAGNHCILVNDSATSIDGIEVWQKSNGASDECIRMAHSGGTLTVQNAILLSDHDTDDQDGIYAGGIPCTVNVINCWIYNFDRAGCHPQLYAINQGLQTWNINSSSFWQCGEVGEAQGGAVAIQMSHGGTNEYVINIHNSWAQDCSAGASDFTEDGVTGTSTWGISYSIDSDNSIATVDGGGVGNQASRVIADSDQGEGSYVIVNDITGAAPFDLSLQDLGNAKNNAQDEHNTQVAEGLTIPATDIVGTARPQNTNYDIGAFEIVAVGGGLSIPLLMQQMDHFNGGMLNG